VLGILPPLMPLPSVPHIGRRRVVAIFWPSDVRSEPARELLVKNAPDVAGRAALLQTRQHCPNFGFVLISIVLELDTDGIVSKEDCRDLVKEITVLLPEAASLPLLQRHSESDRKWKVHAARCLTDRA